MVTETPAFSSNICEKLLDSITEPERNKTYHLSITTSSSRKLLASYFIHRFKKEYYYNYYLLIHVDQTISQKSYLKKENNS